MNKPKITVVVPVYNMGRYLDRAIDCLIGQTYTDFEILIIDDGSNDGSSDVCDYQESKDERISVIHKDNGGLSSARNCGIEHAKGQFIIFPDPDDWVDPAYLESLISVHRRYGSDLEICAHFISYDNQDIPQVYGGTEKLFDCEKALTILMGRSGFCGFAWNKLFHVDIINGNNLRFDTELGMAQDLHFAFKYITHCESIGYSPIPTYHYYQEGGGVTTQHHLTKRKISGLLTYKKIADLSHDKYPSVERAAFETMYNMSLHYLYIYYESKCHDKELYKMLLSNIRQYGKYFHQSDTFSLGHKILGRFAEINPKIAYSIRKILRRS